MGFELRVFYSRHNRIHLCIYARPESTTKFPGMRMFQVFCKWNILLANILLDSITYEKLLILYSFYNLAGDLISLRPSLPRYCCQAIWVSCCACKAGLPADEFCKKDWCPGCERYAGNPCGKINSKWSHSYYYYDRFSYFLKLLEKLFMHWITFFDPDNPKDPRCK